ncbi:unnamed protein product [Allacma fusca]|uniref:Uncharacterized protein n=1 Tax=Allacma fusca TaxID=39272 RepID=A0A8J2M072_9HEXA|nr:unnamed protein product [Allacma fusca]
MNFVRERGNAMDSLNTQMEKYNEDFQTLQEEIYQVASEKMELHKAYEALLEEHNTLLKERQSYEGILNLILKEKRGTEESIHQILETLINKLNAIAAEEGTNSRFAVLESALHAVQGQNSSYRDEITELKCKLNTVEQNNLTVRSELEGAVAKARCEAEESRILLQVKTEEFTVSQNSIQEKHAKLQELHEIVASAKADVEKALVEKETELAKQQVAMEGLQKANFKLQKKIQELQKTNTKVLKETQEHKRNIEQLNTLVSQLRNSLKEQKTQWSERLKSAGDESSQVKDHCRWLQSQIDNLNHQLAESHERIKKYEKDKTTLAQQVMSAEEERKVVDRKLEELRAALQGDTVLREALMERNEALQIEINRLRRAKLMNLVITKEGDHSEPPSEMSTLDAMSSLASVPPTYLADKGQRKNRYAAGIASNYPGKDTARNAISAHSSGMTPSQGESPSCLD